MRAVILAGGAGSRLRPLTLRRPAALLPVAGRPVVEYLLEHLARYGVADATLALHHCPSLIEPLLEDGARFGLRLEYALERVGLGTAGAARRVAAGWSEPFILVASTALITTDLSKALAFHDDREAALTVVCAGGNGQSELMLDDDGGIVAPGGSGRGVTSLGLAIINPEALAYAAPGRRCDLLADLVPRLRTAGLAVRGYVSSEPGLVIRTPSDLLAANWQAIAGELPDLVLRGFEVRPGIRLCRGARVHPTARLSPPVLVGFNAEVGRDATIEAAVIGDDVIVEPQSMIRGSVILNRTHIGGPLQLQGAIVDRQTLGDVAASTWVSVEDPRILGDTRAPFRSNPGNLIGRAAAAALLTVTVPVWLPCLTALGLETRGRPFRSKLIVGARGGPVRLRRVAVRGFVGRLLERLRLKRAPYLWSVLRGDLHWVGTTPRTPVQTATLVERGTDVVSARPGLVNLADVAPFGLRWHDRLALDRVYAETQARSRSADLRLLGAVLRSRAKLFIGLALRRVRD